MKILIIEDRKDLCGIWQKVCEKRGYECFMAHTIEDAHIMIVSQRDANVILLDACVPGDDINTIPLLTDVLDTMPKAKVVAISSDSLYNNELVRNGAHASIWKNDLTRLLINVGLERFFEPNEVVAEM